MKSKNEYLIPVSEIYIKSISADSPAHKNELKNALDFLVNENTPVLAARNGKVVYVKDDSNEGGFSKEFWNRGNRITIKHEKGEYSAYEHLKFKGALVKIGDKVRAGQQIGLSGNTGYTKLPHLHFEVFRFLKGEEPPNGKIETLKIIFKK